MTRGVSAIVALLWTVLILRIVVPWGRFVDHPHWGRVVWMPFVSPPRRLLDVVLNVLLYVPLGAAVWRASSGKPLRNVLVLALLLTTTTEWSQLYSHSRIPSLTDVVSNALGAWLGGLAAWYAIGTPQGPR